MARAAREDVSRQYVIKRVTNIFATAALIDAGVSYGILIYLLNRSSILRDISSLVASVQLVCLLPISIITALIMIRSGASYQTRLDAIGAWTLVCLLNLLGNAGFGFSVLWPDFDVVFNMSITFTVLLIWKAFFVLLQLTSLVYSLCVLNNPVKYVNEDSPRRVEVQPRPSEPPKNEETYDKIQNTHPPTRNNSSSALMLHGKSNPAYESYLSLANSASSSNVSRPTQNSSIHLQLALPVNNLRPPASDFVPPANNFSRNNNHPGGPRYGELSLNYALNHSPHDDLIVQSNSGMLSSIPQNLPPSKM